MKLTDFLFRHVLIILLIRSRIGRPIFITLVFGFQFIGSEVNSAFDKKEVGASSFALGNAVVAIDEYIFAVYYNPAAIPKSTPFRMAFTFQNYFGIADLNEVDLTTHFSLAGRPFSIAVNRFGSHLGRPAEGPTATDEEGS